MKNITELPYNIDAEKSVLGSLIISRKPDMLLDELISIIQPSDFYRVANKIIYLAMLDLFKKNKPIDNLTVIEALSQKNQLEAIGGTATITELVNYVPSVLNIKYYAEIVKDKAIRREYIRAGEIIKDLANNSDNTDSMQEEIDKTISKISQRYTNTNDIPDISQDMQETINDIETIYHAHESGILPGIDTGFEGLNNLTYGLQKGNLIILAARPAMGKSAFALSLAKNIAIRQHIPTAIFSLEMSKKELLKRLISMTALIDLGKINLGKLDQKDWEKCYTVANDLANRKNELFIDDSSDLSISQLRAKARKLKREKDIQLVIIDYLQLMVGNKKENRQQEVAEISRQLKIIARELNITVIALSQLSRTLESRTDKRPILSDLRDSGAIEQDADIVAFLYRADYYYPVKTIAKK